MRNKTDDQLKFIIEDCFGAVAANPQGHKAMLYLREARDAQDELQRRDAIRYHRGTLKQVYDYLAIKAPFRTKLRLKEDVRRKSKSIQRWAMQSLINERKSA